MKPQNIKETVSDLHAVAQALENYRLSRPAQAVAEILAQSVKRDEPSNLPALLARPDVRAALRPDRLYQRRRRRSPIRGA